MSRLQDLNQAADRDLLGNMCLSKAGLAIGTVKSGINTANAITYSVGGVIPAAKAAMTSQALTNAYSRGGKQLGNTYVQPANTTVFYTLSLKADGTVAVTQGTYAGQILVDPTQNGVSTGGDGLVPNAPAGHTPFGVIKVATGATTFTLGTTLLDAANVTATFYDVSVLPATL